MEHVDDTIKDLISRMEVMEDKISSQYEAHKRLEKEYTIKIKS